MPVKCSKPERPTVTPIHVSELRDARPHGASNREAGQPRKLQHTGPCQDREPGQCQDIEAPQPQAYASHPGGGNLSCQEMDVAVAVASVLQRSPPPL